MNIPESYEDWGKHHRTIHSALKIIKARCFDCCGFEWNRVKQCDGNMDHGRCILHPYRFGKRPPGYGKTNEPGGLIRPPTKAIRQYCYVCSNYSTHERTLCPAEGCPLWLWRSGKNPHITEATRKVRQLAATRMHETLRNRGS